MHRTQSPRTAASPTTRSSSILRPHVLAHHCHHDHQHDHGDDDAGSNKNASCAASASPQAPLPSTSTPGPSPRVTPSSSVSSPWRVEGGRRSRHLRWARLRRGATLLLLLLVSVLAWLSAPHASHIRRCAEDAASSSSSLRQGACSDAAVPSSMSSFFAMRYAYALSEPTPSPPPPPSEEGSRDADAHSTSRAAREASRGGAHLRETLTTEGTPVKEGSGDTVRNVQAARPAPTGQTPEPKHGPRHPTLHDDDHDHPHTPHGVGPLNELALAARMEGLFRSSLHRTVPPNRELAAQPNSEAGVRWRWHHEGGPPRRAGEELYDGATQHATSTAAGESKRGDDGDLGVRDALDAAQDAGGNADTVVFDGTEQHQQHQHQQQQQRTPPSSSPHSRRRPKRNAHEDDVQEALVGGKRDKGDGDRDKESAARDTHASGAASSFFSSSSSSSSSDRAPRQERLSHESSAASTSSTPSGSGAAQCGTRAGDDTTAASGSGGAEAVGSEHTSSSRRTGTSASHGPHLGDNTAAAAAAVNRVVAPHDNVARNVQNRWREYRGSYPTLRELIRDLVWSYKEEQGVKQACRTVLAAERGKWTPVNGSATCRADPSPGGRVHAPPPLHQHDSGSTSASSPSASECEGSQGQQQQHQQRLPTLRTSLDWVRYLPYVPIFPIEEALQHLEHERDDDILLALFYAPDRFNTYNYVQWISLMVHATCSLLRVGAIEPIARVQDDLEYGAAGGTARNRSTASRSAAAAAPMHGHGGSHDRRTFASTAASSSSSAAAASPQGLVSEPVFCAGLTLPSLDGLLSDDDVRRMRNNTVRVAIIDGYYPQRQVSRAVWRHLSKDTYHVREREWDLASKDDNDNDNDDEAPSRSSQRAAPTDKSGISTNSSDRPTRKGGAAPADVSAAGTDRDAGASAHTRGSSADSATSASHDAAHGAPPRSRPSTAAASEAADDWGRAFMEQRNALLRLLAHEGGLSDGIREALRPFTGRYPHGGGDGDDAGVRSPPASATSSSSSPNATSGDRSRTGQFQQHDVQQQQQTRRDEGHRATLQGWSEQQGRHQQRQAARPSGRHSFNSTNDSAAGTSAASAAALEAEAAATAVASARAPVMSDEAASRGYWRDRMQFLARYLIDHNETVVLDRPGAMLDVLRASLDRVRRQEQRLVEKVFSWGQTMKYRLHVNVSAQRMQEFSSEHLCDSRYRGLLPTKADAAHEERDDDDNNDDNDGDDALPARRLDGHAGTAPTQPQHRHQEDGAGGHVLRDEASRRFSIDTDNDDDDDASRGSPESHMGCHHRRRRLRRAHTNAVLGAAAGGGGSSAPPSPPPAGEPPSRIRRGTSQGEASSPCADDAGGDGDTDYVEHDDDEGELDAVEPNVDSIWGPEDVSTHELNVQYVDGMEEVGLDEDDHRPSGGAADASSSAGTRAAPRRAEGGTTPGAAAGSTSTASTSSSDSMRLLGAAARRNHLLRQNPPVLLFPRKQGSRPYVFPQTLLRRVHLTFPEARGQLSPREHAHRLRSRWGCLPPRKETAGNAKADNGEALEGARGGAGMESGAAGAAAGHGTGGGGGSSGSGSGTSSTASRAPPKPFTYRVVSVLDNPFSRIGVEHLHYDFVIAGPSSATPIVQLLVEEARRVSSPGELEGRTHRESLYRLQRREWREARAKAAPEEQRQPEANKPCPSSSSSPLECEQGREGIADRLRGGTGANAARRPRTGRGDLPGGDGGDQEAYFFEHDVSFRLDPDRFIERAPLTLHFFLRTPAHVAEEEIIEPLRFQVNALRRQLLDAIVADAYRYGACEMMGNRFMQLLACGSDAVYVNGTRQSREGTDASEAAAAASGDVLETSGADASERPYAYTPPGRVLARALRGSAALSVWRFAADIQRRSVEVLQAKRTSQDSASSSTSSATAAGVSNSSSSSSGGGSDSRVLEAVSLPQDIASFVELLHAPYDSALGMLQCTSPTTAMTVPSLEAEDSSEAEAEEEGEDEEFFGLHTPFFFSLLVGQGYGLMGADVSYATAAAQHQRFLQHRELQERLSMLQVAVRELVKRSLTGATASLFQLISADPAAALLVQPPAAESSAPSQPPACMARLNTTYVAALHLFFNRSAETHLTVHPLNRRRIRLMQRLNEAVRLSRQARLILLTASEEDYHAQYVDMIIQDASRRFSSVRQLQSPPKSSQFFSTAVERDAAAVVAVASPGDDMRQAAASAEPGWDEADDDANSADATVQRPPQAPPTAATERKSVEGEADGDDYVIRTAEASHTFDVHAPLSPFLFNVIHYEVSTEEGDAEVTELRPAAYHVSAAGGVGHQKAGEVEEAALRSQQQQRHDHVRDDGHDERRHCVDAHAGCGHHSTYDGDATHVDRFDLGSTAFASAAAKGAASHEHHQHDDVGLFNTPLADHDARCLAERLMEEDETEESRRRDAEERNAADSADNDGADGDAAYGVLPPHAGGRSGVEEGEFGDEEDTWLVGVEDGSGDNDDATRSGCSRTSERSGGPVRDNDDGHCVVMKDKPRRSLRESTRSPPPTSPRASSSSSALFFYDDAVDDGDDMGGTLGHDDEDDAELLEWLPATHRDGDMDDDAGVGGGGSGGGSGGGGNLLDPHDVGMAGTAVEDLLGADTERDDVTVGGHADYDGVLPFLWRHGGLSLAERRRRLAEHHRHMRELRRRLVDFRLRRASTLWNAQPPQEREGQEQEEEERRAQTRHGRAT